MVERDRRVPKAPRDPGPGADQLSNVSLLVVSGASRQKLAAWNSDLQPRIVLSLKTNTANCTFHQTSTHSSLTTPASYQVNITFSVANTGSNNVISLSVCSAPRRMASNDCPQCVIRWHLRDHVCRCRCICPRRCGQPGQLLEHRDRIDRFQYICKREHSCRCFRHQCTECNWMCMPRST